MKEKTTYGMSSELIARLLAIGLEDTDREDGLDNAQTRAKALRNMLESQMPLDPAQPGFLPAVLNRPRDQMLAAAGQTLSEVLLNSETDLAALSMLKDYSSELVRRGGTDAEVAASTVICYAATASALVFHQERITQHSYEKLEEAYGDLKEKQWIPSALKDLFKKAKAVCQERDG